MGYISAYNVDGNLGISILSKKRDQRDRYLHERSVCMEACMHVGFLKCDKRSGANSGTLRCPLFLIRDTKQRWR